jgi:hypothetical protein
MAIAFLTKRDNPSDKQKIQFSTSQRSNMKNPSLMVIQIVTQGFPLYDKVWIMAL